MHCEASLQRPTDHPSWSIAAQSMPICLRRGCWPPCAPRSRDQRYMRPPMMMRHLARTSGPPQRHGAAPSKSKGCFDLIKSKKTYHLCLQRHKPPCCAPRRTSAPRAAPGNPAGRGASPSRKGGLGAIPSYTGRRRTPHRGW